MLSSATGFDQLFRVGIVKPSGIESTAGETTFIMLREQIAHL